MKIRQSFLTIALVALTYAPLQGATTLLAGFNFNNNTADGSNLGTFNSTGTDEVYNSTTRTISPATHGVFKTSATIDLSDLAGDMGGSANNNWGTFAGATNNAVTGDVAGGALAVAGHANNGRSITISVPTVGYEDVILTYATRGTSTGFATHTWAYSTDGINYTDAATITGRTSTSFSTQTVDLSSITSVNDQAELTFRLTFSDGSTTSTNGNNRIDNIQITAVPEPTAALLGAFGLITLLRRRR